jgi:CRISPR-associated exonuclease Cas4
MRWAEADLVPISALQHYGYCPRQCALIHVEQTFEENLYTLRGQRAHERVERAEGEVSGEGRVEFALPLWSESLGLIGKADAVEFRSDGTLFPVEHKVGRRKERDADDLQLCGQALCLEEMFARPVAAGAIFYAGSRRRRNVEITQDLRSRTAETILAVRQLIQRGLVPPPVADRRCKSCSLLDSCLPFVVARLQGGPRA